MKRFGFVLIFLLLLLTISNCQTFKKRVTQEDDIREAVFLDRIKLESEGSTNPDIYFLSFWHQGHDTDPPPEFMKRFRGYTPPVKPVSQSTFSGLRVKDKGTGSLGKIFRVAPVQWINRNEVEVEWEEDGGAWAMVGGTYHLVREGTQWVVKNVTNRWAT